MEETSTTQIQNLNIRLHLVLPSFLLNPLPLALNRPQSLDIGVLHPRFQFHQTISPLQKLCEKMFEDRLETDIAELSLLSRITNLARGANKATKVSSSTSILFDTRIPLMSVAQKIREDLLAILSVLIIIFYHELLYYIFIY